MDGSCTKKLERSSIPFLVSGTVEGKKLVTTLWRVRLLESNSTTSICDYVAVTKPTPNSFSTGPKTNAPRESFCTSTAMISPPPLEMLAVHTCTGPFQNITVWQCWRVRWWVERGLKGARSSGVQEFRIDSRRRKQLGNSSPAHDFEIPRA
jgi:hypothetical protein